ncbi:MAG: TonB-dependent receptor [Bacteroidales bacterium]|nr:TonB-dependent receptor [Bacteroidales bacterium]
MKNILSAALIIVSISVNAQVIVKGKITDKNGNPLVGANIIVKGNNDGVVTDSIGNYYLKVNAANPTLIATYMGYINQETKVSTTKGQTEINFKLKENANQIEGVVISAGTFETSDRKRGVTLQPLDIVTTPSATGDIYGALTTLPGTAAIGEDGRLFVRGGDGYESKTFIDGLLSKKPYSSNVPDLPSRGRFSPFLFSGQTFSTGGYSAEYGQALSSALILNSNALPRESQTDISIMSVGLGVSHTLRKEKSSISVGVDYTNLQPYSQLSPRRFEMNKYPESIGLTLVARQQVGDDGMLKFFNTYSGTRFGLEYPDLTVPGSMSNISIENKNNYSNLTYTDKLGKGWFLKSGVAMTIDQNNLNLDSYLVDESNKNVQAKITLKKNFNENASVLFGAEETYNYFNQDYNEVSTSFSNNSNFDDFETALYAEADYRPISKIALRAGIRGERSTLLNDNNLGTRFSATVKITNSSQLSLAYGNFYQTPEDDLLRFTHNLSFERANHYIANFQWEKSERLFRVEAYKKDYKNLVIYNPSEIWNGESYNNAGKGHSQGVDVFYRDRKTIRGLEFWISYSYVDSKRQYRYYPKMVTPSFAPTHSASFVAKKWIQSITTQFALSTTFSTGRPYNNPNSSEFMDGRAPYYQDISINCSHLRTFFGKSTIIYASINNLLGRDNIYGYRYYSQPNANGVYEAFPLKSDSKRFYFLGIFITL